MSIRVVCRPPAIPFGVWNLTLSSVEQSGPVVKLQHTFKQHNVWRPTSITTRSKALSHEQQTRTQLLQGCDYWWCSLWCFDFLKVDSIGTGSGAMGRHTKRGGYIIDWNKVRTYVVPDLEGFTVSCHQNISCISFWLFTYMPFRSSVLTSLERQTLQRKRNNVHIPLTSNFSLQRAKTVIKQCTIEHIILWQFGMLNFDCCYSPAVFRPLEPDASSKISHLNKYPVKTVDAKQLDVYIRHVNYIICPWKGLVAQHHAKWSRNFAHKSHTLTSLHIFFFKNLEQNDQIYQYAQKDAR